VKIDPENAAALLFEKALKVEQKGFCANVGRAFRRLDQTDVDVFLGRAFGSDYKRNRQVVVEITGWLPSQRLVNHLACLYKTESQDDVRTAIFSAYTRRENENIVIELLEKFRVCPEEQRWAFLQTILKLGDPILLCDSDDKLWIGAVLDSLPFKYRHFANQEIQEKINNLK
jgi:hypothetical protein